MGIQTRRAFTQTASQLGGGGAGRVAPLSEYEAYSASFLVQNPRTSAGSYMRDPKTIRRIALSARGNERAEVARAMGRSASWLSKFINSLPPHLR